MTTQPNAPTTSPPVTPPPSVPPRVASSSGTYNDAALPWDEMTEKRIDEIEMIGEEAAAGYRPGKSEISADLRYLHSSRTIHQLVTDRNRTVGLYLAVASLLWTASSALLNAKPTVSLIVPIETLQKWCMPVTAGTLAVLAVFASLLLIRTRIGLIYEVAKMNVMLGLPVGRVRRLGPLSVFSIMHWLISLAGGCSAGFFAYHLFLLAKVESAFLFSTLIGVGITVVLVVLYVATILYTTADKKLAGAGK